MPIQPSTSQKYKNKITKTNSYEKEDTKKILFYNAIPSSEQNKSFHKLDDDYFVDDNENINVERKLPRTNNKFYNSLKLTGNNKTKNINKIKIIIGNNKNNKDIEKITKEENDKEKDKETIVDDYNNNILVEFKKNENNINKKLNSNPGIYNNNRKIIKMNDNNKIINNKK